MAGWNTEHIPVGKYPRKQGSPFWDSVIAYACGATMPFGYAGRYRAAPNRKICKRCKGEYLRG